VAVDRPAPVDEMSREEGDGHGPSADAKRRPQPAAPRLTAAAHQAGFDGIGAYLRHRYLTDRWSAREIAEEAAVSDRVVLRELAAVGVPARRGGHRFYSDRRAAREKDDVVQGLVDIGPPAGFEDWSSYVAARRGAAHLRITEIAAELGVSLWHAQRLAARFDGCLTYYLRPRS